MFSARSFLPRSLVLAAAALLFASASLAQAPAESSIQAPLATKSLLLDVTRAGNLLVAVGDRGHILSSGDGGVTWTQADVPTRAMLTAVYFADAKNGWAVGHDAVVVRTKDGGKSWQRVHYAPEDEAPFLDVWFADASRGFAIGAYGRCFTTSDGGTTWTEQPVSEEDDFHLNQMGRAANGKLYIAAESGNVYRSEDAGATWTALHTAYEGSLFGVLPLDADSLLAFGLRGHMLRSDDAGVTWTAIPTGTTAMLNAGLRLSDGTIVVVGLAGTVLVSSDGGRSFTLRQQESRGGIQSVADAGGGHLLFVGEFGVRRVAIAALNGTQAGVSR